MRADEFAARRGAGRATSEAPAPARELRRRLRPPGAGKTFVFLDIGYHVANGKPWMGMNVRGGPVLYTSPTRASAA
jgi:hypothetical protein